MTDHTSNSFTGSRKVTCKEAATLLREGKATRAFFRPDSLINHEDFDNDIAFVWETEDALFEENNPQS